MIKIGRYNISEVSLYRLLYALYVRGKEIPHSCTWEFLPFARENRDRIKKYEGIHNGERCFIVANGPSLTKTNLDLLAKEKTFGVNRIYLHFAKTSFRPSYYVASNEEVLEQFSKEISQLIMPKFLNWNRRSFFAAQDPSMVFLKSKMVIEDSFQLDLTKPMVFGGTVTFVALQLAFYMGFQKVILVGLDHKYTEKGEPNRTETRASEKDESHFHPDYFPKGVKWRLPDLLRSEIDYKLARQAFEDAGREVVDATIGGNCQVFNKVDYLSLFN